MPTLNPVLSSALVGCGVAFAFAAGLVALDGRWSSPLAWTAAWMGGLALGGSVGLCYYGWARQLAAEVSGQDDELPENPDD